MEEYIALSYIFRLSTELTKDPALFCRFGLFIWLQREKLILLLLYSHFNYKLTFYFILMSKYFYLSFFSIFSIHLHQHMVTLGLNNYYFDMLRCLNLQQVLWPDISLHAHTHLNVPNISKTTIVDDPK